MDEGQREKEIKKIVKKKQRKAKKVLTEEVEIRKFRNF